MRVRAVEETERGRFNAAVAASPLADVLQSWEWGEIKRASGWDALRLIVEDDAGGIRAACSVLRKTPAPGVPPLLYAPRGPVLDYADGEALSALLGGIRARAGGAFMFKCDPPVEAGIASEALQREGLAEVRGGAFGGVQPTAVMVLDLDGDPDKVFAGFKSKWRYNVRLAERKGVRVREGTRNDLPAFYDILLETARRDRFLVRGRSYFDTLWDRLAPEGMAKMFVAEFEDRPIAAILCTPMGERVVYNYGASSNEHRNVMPNHLLQWEAIRWATNAGYRIYDFRGVSTQRDGAAADPHIAGLNRFKEGFGARYVEYAGPFDMSLRAGWYAVWRHGAPRAMRAMRRLRGGAGEAAD